MQPLADLHDAGHARAQAGVDEIGIAGKFQRAAEVVGAGRRGVLDLAAADVDAAASGADGVGLHLVGLRGVEPVLQRGEGDDGFEDGAGRVIFLQGAVDLRTLAFVAQLLPLLVRDAAHETVRVEHRRGGKGEDIAALRVHHHHGAARLRAVALQGALGGLLDGEVDGEHEVLARLDGGEDVFRLAVAEVVHEHGFRAGFAAQFLVEGGFDADDAAEVGQAVVEKGLLAFCGTVIAADVAHEVNCRGAVGIKARGLDVHIEAGGQIGVFLHARDLGGREVGQHGERQGEVGLVVLLEFHGVEGDGFLKLAGDLRDDVAGDGVACGAGEVAALVALEFDAGFLIRGEAGVEGALENGAEFFEIQAEVVARLVFGERRAVAVEDSASRRGHADGAVGLRLQFRLVVAAAHDLHPPEAEEQHGHAAKDARRQQAQAGVVLFELVENQHS